MAQPVTLERLPDGIAAMRLERAHGNAINDELVEGLMMACQEAEEDERIRAVLLTANGKLFCPGLDLQELIELDRAGIRRFVQRFNASILMLYELSKPVVAALHSHAVAGGCVLALTADWRVLNAGARVGLNEVKVGVPFPFGVSMILRESVPRTHLEEVALFGRNYEGEDAVRAGLAHEAYDGDDFAGYCLGRARELAEKDPNALAVTKRYLRSPVVERIRAHDEMLVEGFVDGWFRPATRARIEAVVESIRKR